EPDRPGTWIKEPPGTAEARRKRKPTTKPNGNDGTHFHEHMANDAVDKNFEPEPWVYIDPTTMRPRQWLVGTILMRGYATALGSMGGVGKTAYAIALALTYITGRRDTLGLHVFQRGKAWLITLEDDRDELMKRIAAAMIVHGIRPEDIEGNLFVNDATRRP